MGVIYRAHDPEIDRKVAIKLIRADLLEGATGAEYLARFRREAQAAGRCNHPNIVAVFDFSLYDGNPYLAMEYVEGASLAAVLARTKRFPPASAVRIITQVLDALGAAHAMGIVHRDVKPANILLQADARVKVTDFGISRLESGSVTQTGSVLGTPSYMSPEQARGEPVDARTDLFSAGAVLYEMLSGVRPFPGQNIAETMQRVLNEKPADLRPSLGGAWAGLAPVVERALAKRPEVRFPTAGIMAEALRAASWSVAGKPEAGARATSDTEPDATRFSASPQAIGPFDESVLSTIERRLAESLGPIARHLVRSEARQASSVEELVETLARRIGKPEDRARFLSRALSGELTMLGSRTTQRDAAGTQERPPLLPVEALDAAQRALVRYVGPIAKLLVRRAAAQAQTERELWQRLAAHIEAPAEREAFMRGAPKG